MYLALIFILSLFSSGVGIYSGLWPSEGFKFVRVIAYSANALFAIFPCGHLAVRYVLGEPCWVASLVYITIVSRLYLSPLPAPIFPTPPPRVLASLACKLAEGRTNSCEPRADSRPEDFH